MKVPFMLTYRDLALLRFLHSYSLAKTSDLTSEHFPGIAVTTALRRLRKLEEEGLISRVGLLPPGQIIWRATSKGAGLVALGVSKRSFASQNFEHDLEVSELRRTLEKAKIATSWEAEHEIRHRIWLRDRSLKAQRNSIPDGIMGVKIASKEEFIAMEVELNFKNRDRYLDILRNYSEREEYHSVWYLVPTPGMGKHIQQTWNIFSNPRTRLLWSIVDEVKTNPIECVLNYKHGECRLKQVFAIQSESASAQPPAHS